MKYLLLLASCLTAATSFGSSVTVLESERYSNLTSITIKTVIKASSDSRIFAKRKAEKKAVKEATANANAFFGSTCTEGLESEYIDHSAEECVLLNKQTSEVKCTVQSKAYCNEFTGISSASGLNFKLGHAQASTACLNLMKEKNFSTDQALVKNCNTIKNLIQFECTEILTRYNSVQTYSIGECGKFENSHALKVLREYSQDGEDGKSYQRPDVATMRIIAKVDTLEEETCFKNKMRLSSLSTGDLSKCTNEVREETDNLMDTIRDWFN